MRIEKPFLLFGAHGKAPTSMAAYLGSHYTVDEARAQLSNHKLAWAEIVVLTDTGPKVIWRLPETEKKD